jgi:hypothetical protein
MARATKTLEQRLEESAGQINMFPTNGKANYWAIYRTFTGYLNQHIHPQVTMVAMLKDGGYLTDHGPDHITTVIQRASDLLGDGSEDSFPLSPYEIFILLVAIHIHDAGHVKNGRSRHEANTGIFLQELQVDAAERRLIKDVAKVHGGVLPDKNRDTISSIYPTREFQGFEVRLQFLAAILRFADELSDDQTRGSRYLLDSGTMPRSSEIYHAYAIALPSVSVDLVGKEVRLNFQLSVDDARRTFGKGKGKSNADEEEVVSELLLLDEIYIRTFKMYCECIYCMRYFPTELQLKAVNVRIDIINKEDFEDFMEPIGYKMIEQGYPTFVFDSAAGMCSTELTIDGREKNGMWLKEYIETIVEQNKTELDS